MTVTIYFYWSYHGQYFQFNYVTVVVTMITAIVSIILQCDFHDIFITTYVNDPFL